MKFANLADTICAGPNWKFLELSGKCCNVSPFSADYQSKATRCPIVKCAMVYMCPASGASVVLVAHQALWFGTALHCYLINPHQIRSHGYGACDDPWDPHRPLGLDVESIFIPLTASGPKVFFESRVPKDWELSTLPIIEITAPTWDPADLQMAGPRSFQTRVVNRISTA